VTLGTASLSSPIPALASLLIHGCDKHAQLCQQAEAAREAASGSDEPGSAPEDPGPLGPWLRKCLVQLVERTEAVAKCLLGDVPRSLLRADTSASARALLQAVADTERALKDASDAQVVRAFRSLQEESRSPGLSLGMLSSLWESAAHLVTHTSGTSLQQALRQLLSCTNLSYAHTIPPKLLVDTSGGSGKLERLLVEHAALVFCTVSVAGRSMLQAARCPGDERCTKRAQHGHSGTSSSAAPGCGFHVCIIDEAAQLVEAETAIIMQVGGGDASQAQGSCRSVCIV
jgi:hypothetical protein